LGARGRAGERGVRRPAGSGGLRPDLAFNKRQSLVAHSECSCELLAGPQARVTCEGTCASVSGKRNAGGSRAAVGRRARRRCLQAAARAQVRLSGVKSLMQPLESGQSAQRVNAVQGRRRSGERRCERRAAIRSFEGACSAMQERADRRRESWARRACARPDEGEGELVRSKLGVKNVRGGVWGPRAPRRQITACTGLSPPMADRSKSFQFVIDTLCRSYNPDTSVTGMNPAYW
jgi:hypothetical protein